jgi:homoserine O-acetyltransferase
MRMARKLGVITYPLRAGMGWPIRPRAPGFRPSRRRDPFGLEFEVESYLEGHARRFVRRSIPTATST